MIVRLVREHASPEWLAELPRAADLRALVKDGQVDVTQPRAREIRALAVQLPGWRPEAPALVFVGLMGRPPSPRRSAGGKQYRIRFSAAEAEAIERAALSRRIPVAEYLRNLALQAIAKEEE